MSVPVAPRGAFVLSLDFELVWGTRDLPEGKAFGDACIRERAEVFDRLLDTLAEFAVPATWCTVGHLMLDSCAPHDSRKHPEIVRPDHAWFQDDWFIDDPCSDETTNPLYYAQSLVRRIQDCRVRQEIGCHSFSHPIFGDPGCSRACAESELQACIRAAEALGIEMSSFAFPRNSVGHLDVLAAYGLTCFRGPEPVWYARTRTAPGLKRAGHLADVLLARCPPVVMPKPVGDDLVNLPGSMMFFPMHGMRRYIPMSRRVRRAVKGIRLAADTQQIFHLWFHPTNLADQTEKMFSGLREILAEVVVHRERGTLDCLTMAEASTLTTDAMPSAQPSGATWSAIA